jgi:hypothetical protein
MRLLHFVRHHLPWWLVQYVRGRICLSSAIKLAWVESDDNSGIIGFCDPWPQSEGDEKPGYKP